MDISVIVCCYNSELLLPNTLRCLASQKTNIELNYEVILINNNSTDSTVQVANKLWSNFNTIAKLKVFDEPNPGLANARARGVKEASSEILLFCDDDNWLDENYLNIAFNYMINSPKSGVLGAQTEGVLEGKEPEWWKDKANGYAVGKQLEASGQATNRRYVWGAGMVIRKEILEKLIKAGFQSLLMGRSGETLSSGDDSEICRWAIIMGYDIWYLEELKLKHFITERRLSQDYVDKLYEGHHSSQGILKIYDKYIEYLNLEHKNSFIHDMFGVIKYVKSKIYGRQIDKIYRQFNVGTLIKISPEAYQILKTHQKLKKLIN